MKIPSNDPTIVYTPVYHRGYIIFLIPDDLTPETVSKAKATCDKHRFTSALVSSVYYLRGHKVKSDYDQTIIGVVEAGKDMPEELWEVIHCLAFWNQEGRICHQVNAKPGETYTDFILGGMAADCKTFVQPYVEKFTTGTSGNHVWITEKPSNKRIFICHF